MKSIVLAAALAAFAGAASAQCVFSDRTAETAPIVKPTTGT